MSNLARIKTEILKALAHTEAEDGLYFENLINLHEDEERPPVSGDEEEVLDALTELIRERKVIADESGEKITFMLTERRN